MCVCMHASMYVYICNFSVNVQAKAIMLFIFGTKNFCDRIRAIFDY